MTCTEVDQTGSGQVDKPTDIHVCIPGIVYNLRVLGAICHHTPQQFEYVTVLKVCFVLFLSDVLYLS